MDLSEVSLIFFIVAACSAQEPFSNSQASSSGSIDNGDLNLGNEAISGFIDGIFQSQSFSQNSASGGSATINSQTSSNSNTGPINSGSSVVASAGANSGGTAVSGTLANGDHSNTSSNGAIIGHGQSQISGSGAGISLNSNANANVNAASPISTTAVPATRAAKGSGFAAQHARSKIVSADQHDSNRNKPAQNGLLNQLMSRSQQRAKQIEYKSPSVIVPAQNVNVQQKRFPKL